MPKTLDEPALADLSAPVPPVESSLREVTDNLNRLIQVPEVSPYAAESPIDRAMELLGDKYSLQILHILQRFQCLRFVELEQRIPGISPRTLSARLKHLEKFALIHRRQFPTIPPKVEYALTERGQDLAETLKALEVWVDRWYPCDTSTRD